MLPQLIAGLIEKHPDQVKVVFVGYAEIEINAKVVLVKKHSNGENDWLTNESDEYIRDHIENMIGYSKMIKKECDKHLLPYFDTSEDFLAATDAATEFLVGDLN